MQWLGGGPRAKLPLAKLTSWSLPLFLKLRRRPAFSFDAVVGILAVFIYTFSDQLVERERAMNTHELVRFQIQTDDLNLNIIG